MWRFILSILSGPPSERKRKKNKAAHLRSLVQRFARGNVKLQEGRYITKKRAKELKESALRSNF